MSGKTVSAVNQAKATRVKANKNPDFNKVLESRKNALILDYLNNNHDPGQKLRDFQVSFSSETILTSFASGRCRPPHLRQ